MARKNSTKSKNINKPEDAQDQFWMSPARLLGLSDGVIAIAITILAIKLIPLIHENEGSISAMGPELYQYAIGFLSLGIYWVLHHHIFHIIKRADAVLVWLNIVFLAFASLGPFWTAFITLNLEVAGAAGYLGISACLTFISLLIILLYAFHGHQLVDRDLDERVPRGFANIILVGSFIIFLGGIAGLYSTDIFGLFSLASLLWFVYMTGYGYEKYFKGQKADQETTSAKTQEFEEKPEGEPGSFWISPERISMLTDGVIAIAITLMVLELPIPDLKKDPNGLWEMAGDFFLIGIGFLALGLYWAIHYLMFHYIKRADGVLMWLNIIFLAFASLVPFWVAYLNVNAASDEAMFYYGVALTLTLLMLLFIWVYATSDRRLVSKDLGKNIISGFTKFMVVFLIFTSIIFVGNIMIPGFKYGSWIFSIILFTYLTSYGYKKFLGSESSSIK